MQALNFLILLISCFFANQSTAQTYFGKVKCDSFLVMQDTSRALIYRKNKIAVFDKDLSKFLFKPTKDAVFYLNEQDLLVQVKKKGIDFVYLNEGTKSARVVSENPNIVQAEFSQEQNKSLDSLMRIGGLIWNFKTGELQPLYDEWIKHPFGARFMINRLPDDLLLINHTKKPELFERLNELLEFEGAFIDEPGITASGVYDMVQNKWLVPPVYEWVELYEDGLLCLKQDTVIPILTMEGDAGTRITHSYDFYELKDAQFNLLQENITENNEIDLARFIGVDSVEDRYFGLEVESNEFITHKNGKQGLVQFQLFDELDQSDYDYSILFPPSFDFVLNDINGGKICTYDSNAAEKLSLYSWETVKGPYGNSKELKKIVSANKELIYATTSRQEEQVLVDGQFYYWPELIKTPGFESSDKPQKTIEHNSFPAGYSKSCGLQFFNDSLLYVLNFENDQEDLFVMPLHSVLYPHEDSVYINEDGELMSAYPQPDPGYERSGVYNVRKKQWFVADDSKMIQNRSNGLLLQNVKRANYGLYSEESYSLLQLDGSYLFKDLISDEKSQDVKPHIEALFGEKSPVEYIEYPEKSIYRENYGYDGAVYRYTGEYYAVILESGQWQIQQPIKWNNDVNMHPITKPADFVHYNPSYDYYFWMDQDSLYLEIGAGLYAAARNNGKIDLDINDTEDGEEWRIHLISGNDTLTHSSYLFDDDASTYTTASFYLNDDLLFINEPQFYDNITPNMILLDGFWEVEPDGVKRFKKFNTETSYICQLENGVWKKVTPYYAFIESIPFGYIVSTGYEQEIVDLQNYIEKEKPARYLILGADFKAISYLDFYDFANIFAHPIGVQVCLDNGCFLLDNEGGMITSADWDEFLLEGDRIKAVRYKPVSEDEYWFMDGELEIEEYKYYNLNK